MSRMMQDYLKNMVTLRKQMPVQPKFKYSCIEDFLLQNGQEFTPAPKPRDVPTGELKNCFNNVYRLVTSPYGQKHGLLYVEGMGLWSRLPLPLLHAWCIDQQGRVIDPTWCRTKDGIVGTEYFGVAFNMGFMVATAFKRKYFGVIDNWEQGWPLLCGEEGFKAELALKELDDEDRSRIRDLREGQNPHHQVAREDTYSRSGA